MSQACSVCEGCLASRIGPAGAAVENCAGQKGNGAGSLGALWLLLLSCGYDSKSAAALGTPACQYRPAGFAAHPLAKAVIVEFLAIRRLKCPFHILCLFLLLSIRQFLSLNSERAKVNIKG